MGSNPAAKEAAEQSRVIKTVSRAGALACHFRPVHDGKRWLSPTAGNVGWPDLMVGWPDKLWVRELKRKPNTLTDEQAEWLRVLDACGVDADVLWVPDNTDEFIDEVVNYPRVRTSLAEIAPPPPQRRGPRATELQCQSTITDTATLLGYRWFHPRRSVHDDRHQTPIEGDPGWPDLILAHPRTHALFIVELKRSPNTIEDAQVGWMTACRSHDARVVWVPEQLDGFLAELAASSRRTARST